MVVRSYLLGVRNGRVFDGRSKFLGRRGDGWLEVKGGDRNGCVDWCQALVDLW